MGLDGVEFIMAAETAFGVEIADHEAERIRTPRDLIRLLRQRLPAAEVAPCLTQRAFSRVRTSVLAIADGPFAEVRPSTSLEAVMPGVTQREAWRAWGERLGAPSWGPLPGTGWWARRRAEPTPTLGDVARHLVTWAPATVKGGHGWTDAEIQGRVVALIREELGIDMANYTLDSEFVRDMGIS
jgi:acyl carrier protein